MFDPLHFIAYIHLTRSPVSNSPGLHSIRQAAYEFKPGDTYRTRCYYRSENGTVFGKESTDEMCETLVLYYPAMNVLNIYPWGCVYDVPVKLCNASMTSDILPDDDTIHRTFSTGSGTGQCSAKLPDGFGRITKSSANSSMRIFLWSVIVFSFFVSFL